MRVSVAAALGASVAGVASAEEVSESDTPGAPSVRGDLKRFSTTAFGAEVTGPFVFDDGSLLYSLQHPEGGNPEPFGRAAVGYFSGFQFEFNGDNDDFPEVGVPDTEEKQRQVRSAAGDYEVLVQGKEPIQAGSERLGVPQTPNGTDLTEFEGTSGGYGNNPDCNQFVATDDEGTEGYLFTNWENYPGAISRVPLSRDEPGEWSADTDSEEAINVVNTEPFRDIGGTWVNCYGDLSPWGTMISAEENYSHPRVSYTYTVGDIVESGTGVGKIGGCQFWNRPNPSEIGNALGDYVDDGEIDEVFTIQGSWSQSGIEKLAYYLGAEPVDQTGDGNLATTPIADVYPNPYRYGYFVDIRDPAGDPPNPIKYWVMGRAAWEAPDIQGDRRTVYGCSDGDSKGIYKFVADEPIDEYDDTDDIAGTLFAPKITNDAANAAEAGERNSPAQTPLDVEWLPLGSATNGEVESWIAEYDDVTQADYLETHADTDWQTDPAAAVREADLEVIRNGNRNYITNEEIVEWAAQYEENGPAGVDEELRRVPFLETRAAAKEIGASIEFNKAEGVDSVDDSEPGDFVYFGISELNDALADDEGDVQLDRVDGGVVYRAELEPDYNVSTLEPVITGPDFTDSPEDADDALRNIDNVYTMRDGRVLCCEDGFGGPARSYPNDGLYVFQPNVRLDVSSVAVGQGDAVEAEVVARNVPEGIAGGEFTVSVADPDVVGITSASYPDSVGLSEPPTVTDDGATASFRFADVDDAMEPADTDFTLATVTLTGRGAGVTDIDTAGSLDDDDGEAVDVEARSGLAITGPANVGSGGDSPTDPDGDGYYEDVNGNGRVDYADVELLFDNLESDSVASNARAFDFNQNDRLDFDDVVSLYAEVN
ncbi:cell surface protein [Halorubrum saccharovorum DSM 1137]|uniref:Cell surface protein n=2 Tax=Halorubrum saccharovorum TaxID=2248 RepID=M0DMT8_9EURY|nr:alkaline phosphatase PhoX [Halorubrum saccharovorum]ELZ36128.1 cell surface protein [Halorubrum saccharovorum DSM 1137]